MNTSEQSNNLHEVSILPSPVEKYGYGTHQEYAGCNSHLTPLDAEVKCNTKKTNQTTVLVPDVKRDNLMNMEMTSELTNYLHGVSITPSPAEKCGYGTSQEYAGDNNRFMTDANEMDARYGKELNSVKYWKRQLAIAKTIRHFDEDREPRTRSTKERKQKRELEQKIRRAKAEAQTGLLLAGAGILGATGVMKLVSNITTLVNDKLEDLKNSVLAKLNSGIDCISFIRDIIMCFVNLLFCKYDYIIPSILMNVGNLVFKYYSVDFKNYAQELFDYCNPVEAQLGAQDVDDFLSGNHGMIKLFAGVFAGIFSVMFLKSMPGKSSLEGLFNRLGSIGKSIAGVKELFKTIGDVVDVTITWFRTSVLGVVIPDEMEKYINGYQQWMNEVSDFITRVDGERKDELIYTDPKICVEAETLYKQSLQISRDIAEKRLPLETRTSFLSHQKLLEVIFKKCDTTGVFGNTPRAVPVVIWCFGESGVGKSGMTWPLAIDLNSIFVPDSNTREFSREIYFRNTEQEFWDNYSGQNVVVYDDFGQRKDTETTPNDELMEIIRCVNMAPYPLHMAALEDKRKCKFSSKVVLLTSNVFEQKVNSLTFPSALYRRIDLCARVRNHPDFVKVGFNYENCEQVYRLDSDLVKEKTGDVISTKPYLIDLINPESGQPLELDLTYDEFLQKCVERCEKEQIKSKETIAFLTDYGEGCKDRIAKIKSQPKPNKCVPTECTCTDESREACEYCVFKATQNDIGLLTHIPSDLTRRKIIKKIAEPQLGIGIPDYCLNCMLDFRKRTTKRVLYDNEGVQCTRCSFSDPYIFFHDIANDNNNMPVIDWLPNMERMRRIDNDDEGYGSDNIDPIIALRDERRRAQDEMHAFHHEFMRAVRAGEDMEDFRNNHPEADEILQRMLAEPQMGIRDAWSRKLNDLKSFGVGVMKKGGDLFVLHETIDPREDFEVIDLVYDDYIAKGIPVYFDNHKLIDMTRAEFEDFVVDNFLFNQGDVELRVYRSDTILRPLQKQFDSIKTKLIDGVKKIWETHPFMCLAGLLASVVAIGSLFFSQQSDTKDDNIAQPLNLLITHCAERRAEAWTRGALPLPGVIYNVPHNKMSRVELVEIANTFPHSGFVYVVPQPEASGSGDLLTRQTQRQIFLEHLSRVEAAASGDETTQQKKTLKHLEISSSNDELTRAAKKSKRYLEALTIARAEMSTDVNAQTLISNRILKNQYRMSCDAGGFVNILFVRGQLALTVAHVVPFIRKSKFVEIENIYKIKKIIAVNDLRIHQVYDGRGETKEAVIIEFPSSVAAHGDITKHFQDQESLIRTKRPQVFIPTLRQLTDQLSVFLHSGNYCESLDEPVICETTLGEIIIRQQIRYNANTRKGDCGSPIIVNDNAVLRKIMGIHTMGFCNDKVASCTGESITQKDLIRTYVRIRPEAQISLDEDLVPSCKLKTKTLPTDTDLTADVFCDQVPILGFQPLGESTQPLNSPTKTKLRKSLIHGYRPPITKPAYLHNVKVGGETVNLMKKNLDKCVGASPYIDLNLLRRAVRDVSVTVNQNVDESHRRILMMEEAVAGVEGEIYLPPVRRNTSPGFPWVYDKCAPGKTQWLGAEEEYVITDDVREAVEERIQRAREGLRTPTVFIDTLKDERRPIAKVDALKTRVFAAGPMDYLIAFNMYFGGFKAHIMTNRISNECCVGTNPYDSDWAKLAKHITSLGNNVLAGDFSGYDGSQLRELLAEIIEILLDFYDDPENELLRRTLWTELTDSLHYVLGLLISWTKSQPSGNPITTILNCLVNMVLFRMGFHDLAKKHKTKFQLEDYKKKVKGGNFGDDSLQGVSPDVLHFFNQNTLSEQLLVYGFTYTDEQKTNGIVPDSRPLEEVAFLKRGFVYDEESHQWLAPLDITTVMEMPNWIKESSDAFEATLTNCECAVRELVLHGKDVFDKLEKDIATAFYRSTGSKGSWLSYEAYKENLNDNYWA